ncbi:hypothetical protein CDD80_5497 [Ophiocordyceps camponoti-rufipedis]|uniref:chitinase n=1 Tax=Ophiocordyceps camponoti-rufipedis TaxID=2004952 RepID=A0A2C5YVR2_9HYPO|nr:hypothetical protein CDD80_5497 [Ophiocordyceps camponoti-rufipedis]
MSLLRTLAASLAAAHAVVGLAPPQSADANLISRRAEGSSVNMVYWSQVVGGHYELSKLNANDITHLMYAFAKVQDDGTVELQQPWTDVGSSKKTDIVSGRWKEIFEFKKKNPHVKTLMSIGGWRGSDDKTFSNAASTVESRKRFADSATQLMIDGGFDGIDFDWEFPTLADKESYTELVLATRKKLDELGAVHNYHFLLTAAISALISKQAAIDFEKLTTVMDYWYLMAYDYAGAWLPLAQYPAHLFQSTSNPKATSAIVDTDSTIKSMLSRKVAPEKIVLGIPTYAYVYKNAEFGGEWNMTHGTKYRSVRDITYDKLKVDCDMQVAQCRGIDKEANELLTFDTAATVQRKVQYVKEKKLAGTFFWTFNQDFDGPNSLYSTASKALGGLDRSKALLEYPLSSYSNIRGDSKPKEPLTMSSISVSSTTPSTSESSTTSPASTESAVSSSASSGSPVTSFSNTTTTLGASSSSSDSSVAPSSSDKSDASSSSDNSVAPTSTSSASSDSSSSIPENNTARPRIVCAAGERCGHVENEMTPVFDAYGMVIKHVIALMVVVDAGCQNAAVCNGTAEASTKTLTEFAYAKLCPATETPTPATTVTVDASAAAKPVPITKEGRVANLCATEMGCRPTAVPVPEREGGSRGSGASGAGAGGSEAGGSGSPAPGRGSDAGRSGSEAGHSADEYSSAPGRSGSESGRLSAEGSSAPAASGSEAGVSDGASYGAPGGVSVGAKGSAGVKVSAVTSARVSYGASPESDASAAALAPSPECGTVPPSARKAGGVPAGSRVSEGVYSDNKGYRPGAVVSDKTGYKASPVASQRISAPLASASTGFPLSGNKTVPVMSGTGRQLGGSMWALLPAVAVLVL